MSGSISLFLFALLFHIVVRRSPFEALPDQIGSAPRDFLRRKAGNGGVPLLGTRPSPFFVVPRFRDGSRKVSGQASRGESHQPLLSEGAIGDEVPHRSSADFSYQCGTVAITSTIITHYVAKEDEEEM